MKFAIITITSVLFLILILLGFVSYQTAPEDLYKIAESIKFDEVLDDKEGINYYYFYQEDCSHCKEIKPTMTDFYLNLDESEDFYLIDMEYDDDNQKAWYDWAAHEEKYGEDTQAELNPDYIHDASQMKELSDIEITGTPTLIITEDGTVTDYLVGNQEIESAL